MCPTRDNRSTSRQGPFYMQNRSQFSSTEGLILENQLGLELGISRSPNGMGSSIIS